jgi:ABC-type transport system involved in multi-copper enzyme maturation permease subunit
VNLEAIRYRGWSERLRPSWLACWPIARTGLVLILRRKIFWLLLAVALLHFLFLFAVIYLKAQIVSQNPQLARFVDRILSSVTGTGETYRDFMSAQGTVTMLLLAFAGAILVGDDMRQGGLTFYLSRRIGRWHYVVGKLLSIGLLVSLTTTLPALILYLEYGLLTDSTVYFRANLGILRGILGYGLILSVTLGLLLSAMASWLQKTVPLVMSWACLFVMVPALAMLLRHVYDDRNWMLLMLWRNIRLLGTWCFGGIDTNRELLLLKPSAMVVAAVCVLSALALIPRIRAVRVVQ